MMKRLMVCLAALAVCASSAYVLIQFSKAEARNTAREVMAEAGESHRVGTVSWSSPPAIGNITPNSGDWSITTPHLYVNGGDWPNDFDAGPNRLNVATNEVCVSDDGGSSTTKHRTCSLTVGDVLTYDGGAWVTMGQLNPTANSGRFCSGIFTGFSQGTDGGYNGNLVKCNFEFGLVDSPSGVVEITNTAALTYNVTTNVSLICVSATSVWDASTNVGDSGFGGQAVLHGYQIATNDGGAPVVIQVRGPDSDTWKNGVDLQCTIEK